MEATINQDNNVLNITVSGRLDTVNAPVFSEQIGDIPVDVKTINIDLSNLDYIASSGLRVLLSILKKVQKQGGEVILLHPKEMIMEILDTTGFSDIFTVIE